MDLLGSQYKDRMTHDEQKLSVRFGVHVVPISRACLPDAGGPSAHKADQDDTYSINLSNPSDNHYSSYLNTYTLILSSLIQSHLNHFYTSTQPKSHHPPLLYLHHSNQPPTEKSIPFLAIFLSGRQASQPLGATVKMCMVCPPK